MVAKDKFNERLFDYSLFTADAIQIFTDTLHGKTPKRKNFLQIYEPEDIINYMQLIAFLSYDGQLSWKIGGFPAFLFLRSFTKVKPVS